MSARPLGDLLAADRDARDFEAAHPVIDLQGLVARRAATLSLDELTDELYDDEAFGSAVAARDEAAIGRAVLAAVQRRAVAIVDHQQGVPASARAA